MNRSRRAPLIRPALLVILTLAGMAADARAQTALEALQAGARLRATILQPRQMVQVGELRAATDTTIVLSSGASSHTIPLSSIDRLEWSRGRQPNIVAGVAGLLVGVAIGSAVACAANRDSYGVFCGGQDDTKVVLGAALGGIAGGVAGALLFRRERWQPVQLP